MADPAAIAHLEAIKQWQLLSRDDEGNANLAIDIVAAGAQRDDLLGDVQRRLKGVRNRRFLWLSPLRQLLLLLGEHRRPTSLDDLGDVQPDRQPTESGDLPHRSGEHHDSRERHAVLHDGHNLLWRLDAWFVHCCFKLAVDGDFCRDATKAQLSGGRRSESLRVELDRLHASAPSLSACSKRRCWSQVQCQLSQKTFFSGSSLAPGRRLD